MPMKQPATRLSVIIPTHRRADRLRQTLAAAAAQALPPDEWEVIVVEDGATAATAQVVQSAGLGRVNYLTQAQAGPTAARNLGAAQAQGEALVFMDDDIELLPDSLKALDATLRSHPRAAVVGTLLRPGDPAPPAIRPDEPAPFTDCLTGLLCIRAADFDAVGGFEDPTGGWPNWDDVDFGYRAHQAGLALWRSGRGRGIHHDATAGSMASIAERYYRASRAAAQLFRRHPELARHLPMFEDKHPVDWRRDGPSLAARKLVRQMASGRPGLRLMEQLERGLSRVAPAAGVTPILKRWIVGGYIYRGYREGLKELE